MRAIGIFLSLIFLLSAPSLAQQIPLQAGQAAPEGFTAMDSLSRAANFESLKGEKGLVLLFVRSADWCPYCKDQLKAWSAQAEAVKAAGYGLAALSYDAVAVLAAFEQANSLTYPLLSDPKSAVIDAFGIRNHAFEKGSRFDGIPHPAIYVMDASGTVSHVFREKGYKARPAIEKVLSVIQPASAN